MPKEIYAIATLVASIVGVGIFSLPYITAQVGLFTMLGYFLILGGVMFILYLMFAEVSLVTPDYKRLPGFAEYHLGPLAKKIALGSMVISSLGSILAYLIVGGEFLSGILDPIFKIGSGDSSAFYTFLYGLIGTALIFLGIKAIAKIEFWGFVLFFVVLGALFFFGLPFFKLSNLAVKTGDLSSLFLPYGAIVFSLWGLDMIPEIEEMLGKHNKKKLLKKVIVISLLLTLAIYFFFIFLTLAIAGAGVNDSAIASLRDIVGPGAATVGFIFGLIATFTSFITSGLTLEKVLHYDLKISKTVSFGLTCFIPLIVFFIGVQQFIPVISLVGGTMMGVNGLLILAMYNKIRPQKKWLMFPLIILLMAGMILEIIYFVK